MCDDSFTLIDADVVCRQLGFASAISVLTTVPIESASTIIWLDDLGCSGAENSLSNCSSSGWGVHNCVFSENVGIECSNSSSNTNGSDIIRLVPGPSYGRVEVYHSDRWGNII